MTWPILLAILLAAPTDELDIEASLVGDNLVPASRCCAFHLHLTAGGELTTELLLPEGRESRAAVLTAEQLASLRQVITEARFFSLPQNVGPRSDHGDQHVMSIRLGGQSRQVTLYRWPEFWERAFYLTKKERDSTKRAFAVWSAIRSLVSEPRATVR